MSISGNVPKKDSAIIYAEFEELGRRLKVFFPSDLELKGMVPEERDGVLAEAKQRLLDYEKETDYAPRLP